MGKLLANIHSVRLDPRSFRPRFVTGTTSLSCVRIINTRRALENHAIWYILGIWSAWKRHMHS